ncbi:MAG TPA: Gmad2 immunoglobulin-like domain-containing protein [Acidimicrobiales bacterium]|nr:Gmad2 immunoglobulin-like domain-containing protein [Acidimicrobiales bacterium]
MSDTPGPTAQPEGRSDATPRWLLYAILAVLLAIVVVVTLLLLGDDDSEQVTVVDPTTTTAGDTTTTTAPATTTTAEPTTTSAEDTTTTTAAGTTTTAGDQVDTSTAVFPFADDDLRFDDPVEAATVFAETIVGFTDPVVSDYRAGDSRSGEVGVRPVADGPETIILVRQLDEHWWILGAVPEGITIAEPEWMTELRSPVTVRGEAVSPEGDLFLELWTDGADEPLALGQAMVDRDEPSGFEVELTYDQRPATRDGALVVRSRGPSTSGVWEAAVLRVQL